MYADQNAYEKWKEELETSCFNNHGDKCSQLAICYFYENKLKKAYARAQKGCDLNSGEACYHLYDIASALKLKDEALNAEQKACDLKVFQACDELAYISKNGRGSNELDFEVEPNQDSYFSFLQKACNFHSPDSCHSLMHMYENDKKEGNAQALLSRMLNLNLTNRHYLGYLMMTEPSNELVGLRHGEYFFKYSCFINGEPKSCIQLGKAYSEERFGLKKNEKKSKALIDYGCSIVDDEICHL